MVKTAYDRVAVEKKVRTYTRILLFSSTLPILIECQKQREITPEQIHGSIGNGNVEIHYNSGIKTHFVCTVTMMTKHRFSFR